MEDTYFTIAGDSQGMFKDRGSKFLSFAYPVINQEDIQERLVELRKLHPKARHHCYAWRLGYDAQLYRANDDGEPSGTAGRPILGQIDRHSLTNILIVVIRYFGGTLLGTSGLIHAYRESTADSLANADIIEKIRHDMLKIEFDYAVMSPVMEVIKSFNAELLDQKFELRPVYTVGIRKSNTENFILHLKASVHKISLEEASNLENNDLLQIIFPEM
jgi:uncharacterized YigZ family protein